MKNYIYVYNTNDKSFCISDGKGLKRNDCFYFIEGHSEYIFGKHKLIINRSSLMWGNYIAGDTEDLDTIDFYHPIFIYKIKRIWWTLSFIYEIGMIRV